MNGSPDRGAGWLHRARPGKPDNQTERKYFSGNGRTWERSNDPCAGEW